MKKSYKFAVLFVLFLAVVVSGCKKDEPDPIDGPSAFSTLKTYMIDNGLDLPDLLTGWVIDGTPVSEGGIVDTDNGYTIPGYHVFDIRTAEQFGAGHINGAINVALADVIDMAANYTDKPILVVCVTGQTAGHAVMALRLLGFSNAKVLKWGMSGWNPAFEGGWANSIGNLGVGNANWVTSAAPTPGTFSDPTWTSTFTDGFDILLERVDAMLNNGFKAVDASTVLANPGNYQIVNFWSEADYIQFGHFTGAYQMATISLANDLSKAFDPSVTSTVYCYTGQTSSITTAWLNVLGYDFLSIKYGVNALNYDELAAAGKPHWHGANNYEYVTGK